MLSSVSLECSTAVMDNGIPQHAVPNDKPYIRLDLIPFSPEELARMMNKTHGKIWAGSPS